jgi:transcription antitermination factor NusA-like protein
MEIIENGQFILDNITNKLEDESVVIIRWNQDDTKSVINNLKNSKNIEKQIISHVKEIMERNKHLFSK